MGALVVLVAIQLSVPGLYFPPLLKWFVPDHQIHPRRSFHCQSRRRCDVSGSGCIGGVVAVQLSVLGLYLPPVLRLLSTIISTPNDHLAAGPHGRVKPRASGRVGQAGGCPTIRAGIVSPAGVESWPGNPSAPNNHFTAGPHCRVNGSSQGARWWCWWLSTYHRCIRSHHPILSEEYK